MSKFILSAFADEVADDLISQMDHLEKHGIYHIELRGVNGKNVSDLSIQEANEIKKKLDQRGFKISAIGSPIGKQKITDDFQPHFDKFEHVLDLASIFETKYIRMFSFFIPKNENPGKYRDEVLRRWEKFLQAADGRNVVLLHENEKDIYGDIAERCADLLESLRCPYLKVTFDPANFVQVGEKVYPQAYNKLKNYIAYVHIKDALYSTGQVVPAGYGDGCIKQLLEDLHNSGFEGFISLEPHLSSFSGFSSLEPEGAHLPEGDNVSNFAIAVFALKKILSQIN
jgi:sugar phosphate isomerase/epimerase